jgi:uncharacterized DUF497 family protein
VGFSKGGKKSGKPRRTFRIYDTDFLDCHRLEKEDLREDYREDRVITLGEIENRLYVVDYTLRVEAIRLISAKKANQREQRRYGQIRS